jgi:hypothetical protein
MTLEVQTHNDTSSINVGGTHLQGYLQIDGQKLIEKFGEPLLGHSTDKVEYEWNLLIEGEPVTVYSWKNYGEKSFSELSRWHVGARNSRGVEYLQDLGFNATNSTWGV